MFCSSANWSPDTQAYATRYSFSMVFGTHIRAFAVPALPQRLPSSRLRRVSPVFPRFRRTVAYQPLVSCCSQRENVDKLPHIVDCTSMCIQIETQSFAFVKEAVNMNEKCVVIFPATKDVVEMVDLVAGKAATISDVNKAKLFNLKEFISMRETLWSSLTNLGLDRDIINEQFIKLNELLAVIAAEENITLSMKYKLDSLAECISTKILAAYFNENKMETRQIDTYNFHYKDIEDLTTGEILEESFAQMFHKDWISNPTKFIIVTCSGLIAKNVTSGSENRLGMSGRGATAFALAKVLGFGKNEIWNGLGTDLFCGPLIYCEAVTFDKGAFGVQAPHVQSIVEENPMVTPDTDCKALITTLERKCTKFDVEFTTCFGMTKWFAEGLEFVGISGKVVVDGEKRYLSYIIEPVRLTWKIMLLFRWFYQPVSLYFQLFWPLFFRPFWLLYGRHICNFLKLVAQLLLLVLRWIMSMLFPMFQRSDLTKATKLTMSFLLRAFKKISKAFQNKLSQEKGRSGVEKMGENL